MNKVILVGNLTRDPELSETPNGVAVCRFSIAVSRDYASSDGTRETDFFNITVWRGRAENCGKYLKKGNKVAIVGSLQTRSYETDLHFVFADKVFVLLDKQTPIYICRPSPFDNTVRLLLMIISNHCFLSFEQAALVLSSPFQMH